MNVAKMLRKSSLNTLIAEAKVPKTLSKEEIQPRWAGRTSNPLHFTDFSKGNAAHGRRTYRERLVNAATPIMQIGGAA